MTIDKLDRSTIRLIKEKIEFALCDVEQALGLRITLGNARFTSENVTFKLEAATENSDGSANTKIVQDFRLHASRYGLRPTDLGKKFDQRRSTFTIIGLMTNRPKYPILVVNQNGKRYKFPAASITGARLYS